MDDFSKGVQKERSLFVNNMTGKFINIEELNKIMSKGGKSGKGNRAMISKIRKIKFLKGDSKIYFKDDYSEVYDTLEMNKTGNVEYLFQILQTFIPPEAHDFIKRDIKKMLHYVPPVYHHFYLNLPHERRRVQNDDVEQDLLPNCLGEEQE